MKPRSICSSCFFVPCFFRALSSDQSPIDPFHPSFFSVSVQTSFRFSFSRFFLPPYCRISWDFLLNKEEYSVFCLLYVKIVFVLLIQAIIFFYVINVFCLSRIELFLKSILMYHYSIFWIFDIVSLYFQFIQFCPWHVIKFALHWSRVQKGKFPVLRRFFDDRITFLRDIKYSLIYIHRSLSESNKIVEEK